MAKVAPPLPFVDGFCQGLALGLLVVLAVYANTASAGEVWRRAVVADEVTISVNVVTVEELKRKASSSHDMRDVRPSHHGYAVLVRTAAGELRCSIYVTKDATEETLEHERRHCHGWVHQ